MTHPHTHRTGERGFTLVELAIVLVIIGLLIGGVLQGRELINNARVTATIAQIKGFDTAVASFEDAFGSYPGDMSNTTNRLPNCTGACMDGTGGTLGDRRLATAPTATPGPTGEAYQFWVHLNRAALITAVDGSNVQEFGVGLPKSDVGNGGFQVGYHDADAVGALGTLTNAASGHYLSLRGIPTNPTTPGAMTTRDAARIDRKVDDGSPDTGGTGVDQAACMVAGGGGQIYHEANETVLCSLYTRLSL
jgi:prepilin-type N-terminal cleavage/methylation domain-containing protein